MRKIKYYERYVCCDFGTLSSGCVGVGVGVGVDPISFCLPTAFLFNFFCLVFFIVRLPLSAILA